MPYAVAGRGDLLTHGPRLRDAAVVHEEVHGRDQAVRLGKVTRHRSLVGDLLAVVTTQGVNHSQHMREESNP